MDPQDLAPRVAALYERASGPERVTLLNRLLRPVGPLALVTIAAGAFAMLLPDARWSEAEVSLEDTRRVGSAQVQALADYVAQKAPDVLLALTQDRADAGTFSAAED